MKVFNGNGKLMNGNGENHSLLESLQKGCRKILGKINHKYKDRENKNGGDLMKVFSIVFSTIGVISSLQWIWSWINPDSRTAVMSPEQAKECSEGNEEKCPWALVFSELNNKLHLLEMAFKEQVVARESLERGINNQTDLNSYMSEKLGMFLFKLENISKRCDDLDGQYSNLSRRLFSDELLMMLLFLLVLSEFIRRVHPYARQWTSKWSVVIKQKVTKKAPGQQQQQQQQPTSNGKEEKRSSQNLSAPSTPKHGVLKNEMCVVLFRKENLNIYSSVVDPLLTYVSDVKIAAHPYYAIENMNDLSRIPHVKLFLFICDCNGSYGNGTSRDIRLSTIKVMKTLGAEPIVIIGNDEESKKLTGHTQYNSNLRFVFSNEIIHELAANGRVFSVWQDMTSHQMSHLRKMIKLILNPRPSSNIKDRFITISR